MKLRVLLFVLVGLTACTVAQETRKRPDCGYDWEIWCPLGLGYTVCHRRADEECPMGYKTISQRADVNRKYLTISCPNPFLP